MVKKVKRELVSRSEFARRCGISAAAITKACGKGLKAATVGKRVDVLHPDAVMYEARKAEQRARKAGSTETETPSVIKPPHVRGHASKNAAKKYDALSRIFGGAEQHSEEDIVRLGSLTLIELVEKFGSDIAFVDWLKATKEIEMIRDKRIKNAKAEGLLVARELMQAGILDRIDSTFVRLLTDGAKTMSGRAHAISKAGGNVHEIQKMIVDQLSSLIRPAKIKMKKALRDA